VPREWARPRRKVAASGASGSSWRLPSRPLRRGARANSLLGESRLCAAGQALAASSTAGGAGGNAPDGLAVEQRDRRKASSSRLPLAWRIPKPERHAASSDRWPLQQAGIPIFSATSLPKLGRCRCIQVSPVGEASLISIDNLAFTMRTNPPVRFRKTIRLSSSLTLLLLSHPWRTGRSQHKVQYPCAEGSM